MSVAVNASSMPLEWTQNNVLEKGMDFLAERKAELELFQLIWKSDETSLTSAQKFSQSAQKCKSEINALNKAATRFFELETAKNPLSAQSQLLAKINAASHRGLNYCNSVIRNTYYPTPLNNVINHISSWISDLSLITGIFSAAVWVSNYITPLVIAPYALATLKVSLVTMIFTLTIEGLNSLLSGDFKKINAAKIHFEKALPVKATRWLGR